MHKTANGLDYQGRYPEAAHVAIDLDDDPRPVPGAGPVVWLALGAAVLGLVALALYFAARMGWLT